MFLIDNHYDNFLKQFLLLDDNGAGDGGAGAGVGTSAGDPGQGPTLPATPPATPAALDEAAVTGLIDKALKPYQDKIADLSSTNTILQAMLSDRGQQQQAPAASEPQEPALPEKDKFIEEMNNDPAGTILKLINNHVMPKIDKKVGGVKAETQQEQSQRQNLENAITGDQRAAMEIATAWEDAASRELFDQYGEEELQKLCPATIINGKKMPDPRVFRPGMLETAALRADRRLRSEGKAPQAAAAAPAAGSRTVIQFPRSTKPSPGAPNGATPTAPKTIDDLVTAGKLTADDARIAKSNCSKWGLSEDRYVAQWVEVEKENPHYGTGL